MSEPVEISKMHRQHLRDPNPSWSQVSYRGRRVLCDECVAICHEQHRTGGGPVPMPAVRRRKTSTSDLRMCYRHAALWGDAEKRK